MRIVISRLNPPKEPQKHPHIVPDDDMVHHTNRRQDDTDDDMGDSRNEDPRSPSRPASSSQARPMCSSGQEDIGNQPWLVQYGHRDFPYAEYPYGFGQPRPTVSRPPRPAPAPYEDFNRSRSTEREEQRQQFASVDEQEWRQTVIQSRPSRAESLKEENTRLCNTINELQRERLELQYQAQRAILERKHIEDHLDSGPHPPP